MKVAIYARISTPDQHLESQLYPLRELAQRRGYHVVQEYTDCGISGSKSRRPGLDLLMADARRVRFSVVLVAAFDRVARSTKNFLELIDELDHLGIKFLSMREDIDTSGAMGRMFITLIGSIAELERSLIVERIRAGMRRAKLEGQRLGRAPLDIDHEALVQDRVSGMSLTKVAKKYGVSRASVVRFARLATQSRMAGVVQSQPVNAEATTQHVAL